MHLEQAAPSPALDDPGAEAFGIAQAYRQAAHGDVWAALVNAIGDTLAAQTKAEQQARQRDRLISRGYVRGRVEIG